MISCALGASILLVHSPVSIASYPPEPLKSDRRKAGYKLRRWRYALKSQKQVLLRYRLHVRWANLMVLHAKELFQEFFRAESDPKVRYGCIAQKLMHYRLKSRPTLSSGKSRKTTSMMIIREVELFRSVPSHIIDEIAQLVTEESFSAKHVLFREGDFADSLYILAEGQVVLNIQGEKPLTIAVDESGSVFGWSALVEPRLYTATAECTMDSNVIKIDGDRLFRVFERHPREGLMIMRRLAGVIASRLVQSYRK